MNEQVAELESTRSKWWGSSLTIRGALLSAASAVLPVLGPLIGIDIPIEAVKQISGQAVAVAQAIGGLTGMAMTVAGRMRASEPLTRRRFEVRI